jgi:hypothetical protein
MQRPPLEAHPRDEPVESQLRFGEREKGVAASSSSGRPDASAPRRHQAGFHPSAMSHSWDQTGPCPAPRGSCRWLALR